VLATKSKRRRSGRRYVMVHKPGARFSRVSNAWRRPSISASLGRLGKDKSRWMFCDFYGRVLLESADLIHSRGHFQMAIVQLRDAIERYEIRDLVVAVEQTGSYHRAVKRAFAQAGFETRIVHPFATKQTASAGCPGQQDRRHGSGGDPSRDDDRFRPSGAAARSAFRPAPSVDPASSRSGRETRGPPVPDPRALGSHLPGFADVFDLWNSPAALAVARHYASPAAVEERDARGW